MKYTTLKDLKAAYDSGKLNDCSSVHVELEGDGEWDRVFGGPGCREHPDELLRDALDLLNIPWENC